MKMKIIFSFVVVFISVMAKADYWMTFCKTPGGQQYSQVGYVRPDVDGDHSMKIYIHELRHYNKCGRLFAC